MLGDCSPGVLFAVRSAAWTMNATSAMLILLAMVQVLSVASFSIAFFFSVSLSALASFVRSANHAYCRELGKSTFCRLHEVTEKMLPRSSRSVVVVAALVGDVVWTPWCLASCVEGLTRVPRVVLHPTSEIDFYCRSAVCGVVLVVVAVRSCTAPFAATSSDAAHLKPVSFATGFDAAASFMAVPILTNLLSCLSCSGLTLSFNDKIACGSGQHWAGVLFSMACLAFYGASQDVHIHKGWILVDDDDLPRAHAPRIDRLHLFSSHLVRVVAAASANSSSSPNIFMLLMVLQIHQLALVLKVLPSNVDLLNKLMRAVAVVNAVVTPIGILTAVVAGNGESLAVGAIYGGFYVLAILTLAGYLYAICRYSFFAASGEVFVDDVVIVL